MKRLLSCAALPLLIATLGVSAAAQPVDLPVAAATSDRFPAGIRILRRPGGAVYTDAKGRVLYGMDMRTLIRSGSDPAQHCAGECAAIWVPLLAPSGSEPTVSFPRHYGKEIVKIPRRNSEGAIQGPAANALADWDIIAGPQGPQWVYKSWHMVFVRRSDRPGLANYDGAEGHTWNTLKYVPPAPKLVGPGNVQAIVLNGNYILADENGHALFTGTCARGCAGWQPFGAGMASTGIGDWSVNTRGDAPQWQWRGKPVFVSRQDDPKQLPAAAEPLRP